MVCQNCTVVSYSLDIYSGGGEGGGAQRTVVATVHDVVALLFVDVDALSWS